MNDLERAKSILGDCRCHIDYTCRGRKDPHCMWCEYSEEFATALKEVREENAKTAEKFSEIKEVPTIIENVKQYISCTCGQQIADAIRSERQGGKNE